MFVGRGVLNEQILNTWTNSEREIPGKRPRGGCPSEHVNIPNTMKRLLQTKSDGDRGILDVLVVRARLEVRKRRRKLVAVGSDLVGSVDAPLVPELLEHPPHRLHERHVH